MHSARSRGSAGDFTVGRAGLGFGPDLDTANRGTDRRVKGRLLHRDRHPQHAAGGTEFRLHRLHVSRRTDRVRRNRTHLYASETKAYGRLYYRAIWLKERVAMASEHITKAYDEELRRLSNTVAEMGGLAESQLGSAIEAVATRDTEVAGRVIEGDANIDQAERDVDNLAIRLLALRQPVARDLREIFAALKIASDLERIGDYASNVAKRSIAL